MNTDFHVQARRQEMKWGDGSFVKNVENGGGCFSVKKWTFPQRRVHYVRYQYFLLYIFLIGRCIRPLPVGMPFHIPLQLSSATFHELLNTVVRRHVNLHALFKTARGPGAFGKYIMIDRVVCLLAGHDADGSCTVAPD